MRWCNRRKFIKAGAIVTGTGMAGCTSGGNGDQGDGDDGGSGGADAAGGGDGGDGSPKTAEESSSIDLPNRARLIISGAAGGGFDSWGRIGIQGIQEVLNSDENGYNITFQAENVPANDGVVGINRVYNGEGNGSIIGVTGYPTKMVPQLQNPAAEYDLVDSSLIGRVCSVPGGVTMARADSNIDSWNSFIEEVQNRQVVIGTKGPDGRDSIIFQQIKNDHNLDNASIASAIEGKSDQMAALKRGDIELAPMDPTSARNLYEADDAHYAFAIAEPDWSRAPVDVDIRADHLSNDDTEYYPIFATNCFLFGPKRSEMDQEVLQLYRQALSEAAEGEIVKNWENDTGRVFDYRGGKTIRDNNELEKAMSLTEQYLVD